MAGSIMLAPSQWLPGNRSLYREEVDTERAEPARAESKQNDSYSETQPLHSRTPLHPWVRAGSSTERGWDWGWGWGWERGLSSRAGV